MIWLLLYLWLMGAAQSYFLSGSKLAPSIFWPIAMPIAIGLGTLTWALDWWNRDD